MRGGYRFEALVLEPLGLQLLHKKLPFLKLASCY